MKTTCRHLFSAVILTTVSLSFCLSASAEELSVSVEKVGEISDKYNVFSEGKKESFSYNPLGCGFGVDEDNKVRIVDVNGENHIDKLYDSVDCMYHGNYQLGIAAADNNDEAQYDLIKEGQTICYSNITNSKGLHDNLFVFEADGNYVVFDLEGAKELAKIPVSAETDAGIIDNDYWIFQDGKYTFYDTEGKELYTTENKILASLDGKINIYDPFFIERTDDGKYYVQDTEYKTVLTLDEEPDRILQGGKYYIIDKVLFDQQGTSITHLPNTNTAYEMEESFLVQDYTEEKQNEEFLTFYLYDYSGNLLNTFESSCLYDDFGYGYYVLKGKDVTQDMDLLFCPDGKIIEGFYAGQSIFCSPDSNEKEADLYVINDGDFTLKGITGYECVSSLFIQSSSDPSILAEKTLEGEEESIAIFNVIDGKMLVDTDIRCVRGYVGDYFVVESASDTSKWIVYRMTINE